MSHLLDLPVEIITRILTQLSLQELIRCQSTCRRLKRIYDQSSKLQYIVEIEVAGMLDNPRCRISVADKLEALRHRERAWCSLRPTFTKTVPIPRQSCGLYDVTASAYFLGVASESTPPAVYELQSLALPSISTATASHTEIRSDKEIVDFATAIEEHDLIAVVRKAGTIDAFSGPHGLEIVLLRHSTRQPHELADQSIIHVPSPHMVAGINIEISGENLILLPALGLGGMGPLQVYNWKTGALRAWTNAISNQGVLFLREDIFLCPNVFNMTLDIFCIPDRSEATGSIELHRPTFRLSLPILSGSHTISGIECRCEPNPTSGNSFPQYAPQSRPFVNDPERAIAIFSFDIREHTELQSRPFIMLVHRKTLLSAVSTLHALEAVHPVQATPWFDWGKDSVRWLDAAETGSRFITCTSGERYVNISLNARRIPSPISIIDLNQYRIRRALAGFDVYPRHDSRLVTPTRTIGDPEHDSIDEEHVGKPEFTENVVSELSFAEFATEEKFTYDAVMIDEERVIGIRSRHEHPAANISRVDVHYFG
ncbi:hypothetical protein FA15DRAFT_428188 [Coprinopsis marcescibilis]|uniref:F-box domain-containing protein n=1 Tax=Coprinopsis marcescibilis TaxID=230819 RepID=A0A5C3LKG6_COPMA|nr:hypothetical protein FA15DRAFT_428188 [Coprinopsis marcescibilis]